MRHAHTPNSPEGPRSTRVAAILLAAGSGRRFAQGEGAEPKLLALVDGVPLVRRVAETALASRARPVVVVTGHAAEAVRGALDDLPLRFVHNPDHATGVAGSIRAGLRAIPPRASGALVLLGDMPLVTPGTLDRLVDRFETAPPDTDAAVPLLDGRRGNPVLVGRALFGALETLRGDEGARQLLSEPGRRLVFCPVEDRGVEIDVDTQAALRALRDPS